MKEFEEFIAELLEEAKVEVQKAPTRLRYKHNHAIFSNLINVITTSSNEDDFFNRVRGNYDLYCVSHIRLDNRKPMFPAPWQSQVTNLYEKHISNFSIMCRKVGKSAHLTSYTIWKCDKDTGVQAIVFAPSDEQLLIMDDIYKCLTVNAASTYFRDVLMAKESAHKGVTGGSSLQKRFITFGKNGNTIRATNLSQKQEAKTKRGHKGTLFIVDEIGLVKRKIKQVVINPMMSDTYTEKKMIKIGTPEDTVDSMLKEDWVDAQANPDVSSFHMNIWEGYKQGCISKMYIKDFLFEDMRIPCMWGKIHGLCPKQLPVEFEGKIYEGDVPEPTTDWTCDDCCMDNDGFVMEALGLFPEMRTKFFPMANIMACGCDDMIFGLPKNKEEVEGRAFVMSVDYGHLIDFAQIGVFELIGNTLKMVYWEEVPPVMKGKMIMGESTSYLPTIRRIKSIYNNFFGCIYKIFPDATAVGFQTTFDLTKKDPDYGSTGQYQPIPASRIYSNSASRKKNVLGVWMSGPYDDFLFENHRKAVLGGRFFVPRTEPFFSKFRREHDTVIVGRPTTTRPYRTFKKPSGGSIDLLVTCALASLSLHKNTSVSRPYMGAHFTEIK